MQHPTGIRQCLRALCQRELEANSSFGYETSCETRPSLVADGTVRLSISPAGI
jgi:hypothetical protein